MDRETEKIWLVILIFLFGFAAGYLTASSILDNREVTKEDMIELNKTQYYE